MFISSTFGEGFGNTDFVFRGEPAPYPNVLSAIDRIFENRGADTATRLAAESNALNKFLRDGPLTLSSPVETGQLDATSTAMILLRHYGGPTRLVDWTESPWIAAYFATAGRPDSEGRILAFDRRQLTRVVHQAHGAETGLIWKKDPDSGIFPAFLSPRYVESAADWVVAVDHSGRRFPRLVVQQGLFTMASKPGLDHWTTITALIPDHCFEITLTAEFRSAVQRQLIRMGLTAATLFPGPDGVAVSIGEYVRSIYAHPG